MKVMKRFISMFLTLCVCLSTLAAVPVVSQAATPEESNQWGDSIPSSFSGVTCTYRVVDAVNHVVALDVGLQNPTPYNSMGFSVKYDPSVVNLCKTTAGNPYVTSLGPGKANLMAAIDGKDVSADMMANPGSDYVGLPLISGAQPLFLQTGLNAYFGENPCVVYAMPLNIIEEEYKADFSIDTGGDWNMPQNKNFVFYSIFFKAVAGKTLEDVSRDTFQPCANSPEAAFTNMFPNGAGLASSDKGTRDPNLYMAGFPAADTPPVTTQTVGFTVNNSNNTPAVGAVVTVLQDGVEKAHENTNSSGQVSFNLADGSYTYTIAYGGHVTATGSFTVGGAAVNIPTVTLDKQTGAAGTKYTMVGQYDGENKLFTVAVNLHDLDASGGAFGIKYDPDILTLKPTIGFKSAAELDGTLLEEDANKGYHVFGWSGMYEDGSKFIADEDGALLATYKFALEPEDYDKKLNSSSVQVMPYTETEYYQQHDQNLRLGYWTADEASPDGGYYITATRNEPGTPIGTPVEVSYPNDSKHIVAFTAVSSKKEEGTGADIPVADAEIVVKDSAGQVVETLVTDAQGKAQISLNDGSYGYRVSSDSYWADPLAETDQNFIVMNRADQEIGLTLVPYEKRMISWELTNGKINNVVKQEPMEIDEGQDFAFTITPDDGYVAGPPTAVLSTGNISPTYNPASGQYIIKGTDIRADITLYVSFTPSYNSVRAMVGPGGTLNDGNNNIDTLISYNGSSDMFKYKANSGNVIDKIVINGVDVPTEGSVTEDGTYFQYQFNQVIRPQSIAVTFKAKGAESTSSIISVSVGTNGSVAVTSPVPDTWSGQASRDYIINQGQTLKGTITPNTGFVFDRLSVDDTVQPVNDPTYEIGGVTGIAADGQNHSIIVTFKATDAPSPAQYVVTAKVVKGCGAILPLGTVIYNAGAEPEYAFVADPNWHVNEILIGTAGQAPVDETENIKDAAAGGVLKYTFEPLAENKTITAEYNEDEHRVTGTVRYAQKLAGKSGAYITMTRADAKVFDCYTTTAAETGSFDIALPAGVYTMRITKVGHLDVVITGFEIKVTDPAEINIPKAIAMVPGDCFKSDDQIINKYDNNQVVESMTSDGSSNKGDVDEDGITDATDMAYVGGNFTHEVTPVTYAAFIE